MNLSYLYSVIILYLWGKGVMYENNWEFYYFRLKIYDLRVDIILVLYYEIYDFIFVVVVFVDK